MSRRKTAEQDLRDLEGVIASAVVKATIRAFRDGHLSEDEMRFRLAVVDGGLTGTLWDLHAAFERRESRRQAHQLADDVEAYLREASS